MERRYLVEHLSQLPVEELVAILRDVFDGQQPAPAEAEFCRNRFFLGIACSSLESDDGDHQRWEPWTLEAVAYPDSAQYGDSLGPDWGLCQSGRCEACGVAARSNVKHGFCAICGAAVYLS